MRTFRYIPANIIFTEDEVREFLSDKDVAVVTSNASDFLEAVGDLLFDRIDNQKEQDRLERYGTNSWLYENVEEIF